MASIRVQVVYALAGVQEVRVLQLPEGTSAAKALEASGLAGAGSRLGIGGRQVAPGRVLHDGERVDILRPLALDPGEARRQRARRLRKR